jgi:hypothetical protein
METLKLFRNNASFPKPEGNVQSQKVAAAFDYRSTHAKITLIAYA